MRNLFAFIILLVWLTLGAWYYTCKVKNLCIDTLLQTEQTNTPIVTNDNNTNDKVEKIEPTALKKAYAAVFQAENDLEIKKSNPVIGMSESYIHSTDGIAHFLKQHPKTKLNITGFYADDEENASGFENIGLARATMVKENMMDKGVPESQILIESKIDNDMFDELGIAQNKDVIDFKFSNEYDNLNKNEIKDAYKSTVMLQDYIFFKKDSADVQFKDNYKSEVDDIAYYLNRNAEHDLRVEVDFETNEKSTLEDMDIGLIRAYDLKQKLIKEGFQKSRIIINSKEGYGIFDDTKTSKPEAVSINFIFPDVTDEEKLAEMQLERKLEEELSKTLISTKEAAVKDSILAINNGNIIDSDETKIEKEAFINFEFGSDEIINTNGFETVMIELKDYLSKNPAKQVEIVGHTCNVGDNDFNMFLGSQRAEAAKALLLSHGINSAKLVIKSKGEYAPAFDNDNESGRRKNRRVEIDIK